MLTFKRVKKTSEDSGESKFAPMCKHRAHKRGKTRHSNGRQRFFLMQADQPKVGPQFSANGHNFNVPDVEAILHQDGIIRYWMLTGRGTRCQVSQETYFESLGI